MDLHAKHKGTEPTPMELRYDRRFPRRRLPARLAELAGAVGVATATTAVRGWEWDGRDASIVPTSLLTPPVPTRQVGPVSPSRLRELAELSHPRPDGDPRTPFNMGDARDILRHLERFESLAVEARDPVLYLVHLSPLHNAWHTQDTAERGLGLLAFHWHLVDQFRRLGLDEVMGVAPYREADFMEGGRFSDIQEVGLTGTALFQGSHTVSDLENYSSWITQWHNAAHRHIFAALLGSGKEVDFIDSRLNIFVPEFWSLHGLLNQVFERELACFASSYDETRSLTWIDKLGNLVGDSTAILSTLAYAFPGDMGYI